MTSSADGEEDRVVKELDIYVCNGLLGGSTNLYLFQYPLRAPWRPYGGNHDTENIRIKPGVKKVEMEVPIETTRENFNSQADAKLQRTKHKLTSSRVELKTTYAVGSIRGDKVLLCQLDNALQMRPSVDYLNPTQTQNKPNSDPKDKPSEGLGSELKAVQVTYEKTETERQREARKQTHAYLQQQEDEESWLELKYHSAESVAAETIWEKLMTPGGKDIASDLSPTEYLHALVPIAGPKAPTADEAANEGGEEQDGAAQKAAGQSAQATQITDEAKAALPAALAALFRHHAVCSLDNIRNWLSNFPAAGAAAQAASLGNGALQKAVLECDNLRCIRGTYMLAKTGDPQIDEFRDVILGLLTNNRQIKKAEIVEAARKAQVGLSDGMKTKVIKTLCSVQGTYWSLKAGI